MMVSKTRRERRETVAGYCKRLSWRAFSAVRKIGAVDNLFMALYARYKS